MYNPIYSKILNIICKSVCGRTCDKCFHAPNGCKYYSEYSKIALALGRSNLFSLPTDEINVTRLKEELQSASSEKKYYENGLSLCVERLHEVLTLYYEAPPLTSIDELKHRYYMLGKSSVQAKESQKCGR